MRHVATVVVATILALCAAGPRNASTATSSDGSVAAPRVVSFQSIRHPRNTRRDTPSSMVLEGIFVRDVTMPRSEGVPKFGSLIYVTSSPAFGATPQQTSFMLPVLDSTPNVHKHAELLACDATGLDVTGLTASIARDGFSVLRTMKMCRQMRLPENLVQVSWICTPSVERVAHPAPPREGEQQPQQQQGSSTVKLLLALLVSDEAETTDAVALTFSSTLTRPPSPHYRWGSCAAAYSALPMRGWGLEMASSLSCLSPTGSQTKCDAEAAEFNAEPLSIDVVVAVYHQPAAPMIRAVLRALPSYVVQRRVLYYAKGSLSLETAADIAHVRRLVDHEPLNTTVVAHLGMRNVGRCDHTYLLHIHAHYDDLADTTIFLKDTTAAHRHLAQMTNILAFLAKLPPVQQNFQAFCPREAGLESLSFELPSYESEQCWRFRNCYGRETYVRARDAPLERWLRKHAESTLDVALAHPEATPGKIWVCQGGVFAASANAIRTTERRIYAALIDELDDADSLEAGHFMERTWLHLFGVRAKMPAALPRLAVYTGIFDDSTHALDVQWLGKTLAPVTADDSSSSSRLRLDVDFLFFTNSAKAADVAARSGWTPSLIEHPGDAVKNRATMSELILKVAPHRLRRLARYDYTVFVELGRGVDMEAVAASVVNDLSTGASVAMAQTRVCCGTQRNNILGAVRSSLLAKPRASAVWPQLRTYVRAQLRAGARPDAKTFASSSCVVRRMTTHASRFGEAWLRHAVSAGAHHDELCLHFVRQKMPSVLVTARGRLLHVKDHVGAVPVTDQVVVEPAIRTWVFVATAESDATWNEMTKRAVRSAVVHTNLQPVCIFRGNATAPLARWLEAETSATVIYHEPLWARLIEEAIDIRGPENIKWSPLYAQVHSLIATFLRLDVSLLLPPAKTGDLVLYTDTDVYFARDVVLSDFGGKVPAYFTVGTEADAVLNPNLPGSGNAGVMLLNLDGLRRSYSGLLEFVFDDTNLNNGLHFGRFGPGDQGALNAYYQNTFDVISWPKFNWKPYWPLPDNLQDIALVHFHGPKPWHYHAWFQSHASPFSVFAGLLSKCSEPNRGCQYWLDKYEDFASSSSSSSSFATGPRQPLLSARQTSSARF
ncbi:hypothetical protein CTAYLR_000945 [Chrysophaeum taylorii]|uniref:Uncharacterized protein n=1 Tax=Chrysophaeum taylorii TaxID=2483200 RepID=A0AAD7UGN6_9STRA|nr:hypothetical protein CTAYLR_000945 [Chrysophaeum taylorii]